MRPRDKSIPEFKTDEEEAEFWDNHNAAEFIDEDNIVEIDVSGAREKRAKRATQQISLRVSHQVLERTKNRAKTLGVPYQTLIQLWIAERLEREEALVRSHTGQGSKRPVRGS